jgi:DNA gyrase subunit A
MLALVPDAVTGRLVPKVMPVKTVLEHYVAHRHDVIVKRTQFDLDKALEREHILEGLKIAVDNIDEVIRIIRRATDTPVASRQLQTRFKLSERQAEAILNMRLAKLTGLEIEKLEAELTEVRALIADLRDILASRPRRMRIMKDELGAVAERYGDERRSEIIGDEGEFTIEDLIAEEDMVVTISHTGYIKRTPVTAYRKQRRGGRGSSGADLKETDFIERLFIASTHDYIMIFPQAGRATRGKPIVNLINVSPETKIRAIVPVREFRDDQFLFFCTRNGTVKKTRLSEYGNVRAVGIKAIKIEADDALIDVQVTGGTNDVVLATKHGLSIRFPEQDVREMGRDTTGVRGVALRPDDRVISMVVVRRADATLLLVTEKGLGKVTDLSEYRVQGRGGKGIITGKLTDKTGMVVGLMEVIQDDELMIITKNGVTIRSSVNQIRNTGRNASGVRLVNLDAHDVVCAVARVVSEKEEGGDVDVELGDEPTGGGEDEE